MGLQATEGERLAVSMQPPLADQPIKAVLYFYYYFLCFLCCSQTFPCPCPMQVPVIREPATGMVMPDSDKIVVMLEVGDEQHFQHMLCSCTCTWVVVEKMHHPGTHLSLT